MVHALLDIKLILCIEERPKDGNHIDKQSQRNQARWSYVIAMKG